MAITFVNAGTVAAGTGAISPALPASISAGDILLLYLATSNQAITIPTPNGGTWTQLNNSPQGTGTAAASGATRLTCFWSRYNGTQGAPTTSDSGDHQLGRILAFRGCVAEGNPAQVTAGGVEATSDTSGSIPGATTDVDGCMIVAALSCGLPDATGTANFSAWTNASLASITEATDDTNNSGLGGGLGTAFGILTTAGSYGATTVTLANSAAKGLISMALAPARDASKPTFVQKAGNNSASAASLAVGSGQGLATLTAGDCVVVNVGHFGIGTPTVTDNASGGSNSYVQTSTANTGAGGTVRQFVAKNVNSASTITVTGNGSSGEISISVLEFKNCDTASPADGTNSATGTSAAPSVNVTVGSAGDILVGAMTQDTTSLTPIQGDGFLIANQQPAVPQDTGTHQPISDEWVYDSPSGSHAVAFSVGSTSWAIVGVALKGTAGGAMSASSSGTASSTASLTGDGALAGAATGVGASTSALAGAGILAGSSAGSATATATGDLLSAMSGTSAGSATAAGSLLGAGTLAGSSAGVAAGTSVLAGNGAMLASSAGVASSTAALAGAGALAASSAGIAGSTSALVGNGALVGSSSGTATVAGTITDLGSGPTGASAGSSTVAGTLTASGSLGGTSAGVAASNAALTGTADLAGTAPGSSISTALLGGFGSFTGSASGSSIATGILSSPEVAFQGPFGYAPGSGSSMGRRGGLTTTSGTGKTGKTSRTK